jgi:hypothetical protein
MVHNSHHGMDGALSAHHFLCGGIEDSHFLAGGVFCGLVHGAVAAA